MGVIGLGLSTAAARRSANAETEEVAREEWRRANRRVVALDSQIEQATQEQVKAQATWRRLQVVKADLDRQRSQAVALRSDRARAWSGHSGEGPEDDLPLMAKAEAEAWRIESIGEVQL
jgi:hypothetical protein